MRCRCYAYRPARFGPFISQGFFWDALLVCDNQTFPLLPPTLYKLPDLPLRKTVTETFAGRRPFINNLLPRDTQKPADGQIIQGKALPLVGKLLI